MFINFKFSDSHFASVLKYTPLMSTHIEIFGLGYVKSVDDTLNFHKYKQILL
jgi:hypothetical protein